jgi:hypothetical protein
MPSVSSKQRNFMAAVANSPSFAKKAGVPQSVGKEFTEADKGMKLPKSGSRADRQRINSPKTNQGKNELFKKGGSTMAKKEGGDMKHEDIKMDKAMMQKAVNKHESRLHKGEPMTKLAKGGAAKKMASGGYTKAADGVAQRGKTKGTQVKMCGGGKVK